MTDQGAGWAALATAGLSGLALAVAHPPVGAWWTTFLAPGLLLAALHLRPRWSGRIGAIVGLIAFGPMLTWLILPAGFLGWGLLVAIQAGFIALLAVSMRPFLGSRWLPLVTALLWTGMDAWRAVFPLGGFEWAAISYAHVDGSFVLPVARVLGGPGITLLVVLISAAGADVIRRGWHAVRGRGDASVDRALSVTNVPIALLVAGMLGAVLITVEPPPQVGSLDVLVVQGNETGPRDPQPADPQLTITTAMRDLTVAALEASPGADLVVWPESSVDQDPAGRGARLAPLIGEAVAAVGPEGTLLAGMTLDGPRPREQFVNAVVAFGPDGIERDRYVKRQPVPFGEYIPLRRYLDWFPPLDQIPRDAVRGVKGQTVDVGDIEVAVGICFETLFGDLLRESVMAGDEPAGLVVMVTNDASFGESSEPAQHLAQSRLRAVETGRWVVHGALSGSSAIVSPTGEVTAATGLFELATLRQEVPVVAGRTPFLVVGNLLGTATRPLALLGLIVAALAWRRRVSQDR